jgi:hypothetical protein
MGFPKQKSHFTAFPDSTVIAECGQAFTQSPQPSHFSSFTERYPFSTSAIAPLVQAFLQAARVGSQCLHLKTCREPGAFGHEPKHRSQAEQIGLSKNSLPLIFFTLKSENSGRKRKTS